MKYRSKNSYINFGFILVVSILCSCTSRRRDTSMYTVKGKAQIYRDYVLYKCIVRGFNNDPIFRNDISSTVYYDIGGCTEVCGRKLDSLANREVMSIKPSEIADYDGKKAIIQDCINYYNSKELKAEVKKLAKQSISEEKKVWGKPLGK